MTDNLIERGDQTYVDTAAAKGPGVIHKLNLSTTGPFCIQLFYSLFFFTFSYSIEACYLEKS